MICKIYNRKGTLNDVCLATSSPLVDSMCTFFEVFKIAFIMPGCIRIYLITSAFPKRDADDIILEVSKTKHLTALLIVVFE